MKPVIEDCSVTKPTWDGKLAEEKLLDEKLAAYDGCKG